MPGLGECVASVLRESWKPAPPVFSGSDADLEAAAPILFATGAASLGWWKLRSTIDPSTEVHAGLHEAFRMHALQAALQVRMIVTLIPALLDAGIEPLLVKGWAAARTYPEPALRPYGDIDICVSDVARARTALDTDVLRRFNVDLHEGGEHLIDVPFGEVVANSMAIDLDGVAVRIPSDEHHLRILVLHLLHHGAWRPLWLCDIGAALDVIGDSFDWEVFLGTDPVRRHWIACTLRVAESLLGADLSKAPDHVRSVRVPSWFERAVLREWTRRHRWVAARPIGEVIATRPWTAPAEIVRRWPDPIRSSVHSGARFDRRTRFPLQLRYACSRLGKVLRQTMEAGRSRTAPSSTIGP
ncbi:MAG: nucleotidyltransferase family protein [Acidobacteria bacterium]|nr:nucleotidyltransferase family protein [Acidobacteriota bacterium]